MKAQKGFTLIELIIVIVVLGILAVTAAPQFVDFGSDARESSLEGVKGSMNGAADLVYGKAALAGVEGDEFPAAATDYTANTADGIEVVYGYPVASTTGIIAALNIDTADWDIQEEDAAADGSLRMSPVGVNDPATTFAEITDCYVEYTNSANDGERPAISITTTGC